MNHIRLPLFVYGTLRSDRSNAHAISGYSKSVTRACARGVLHYVDYLGDDGRRRVTVALDPTAQGSHPVLGELVEFEDEAHLHALAELDHKELFFQDPHLSSRNRQYVYIRSIIRVDSHAGDSVWAWTYVMVSKAFVPRLQVEPNSEGLVEFEEISAEDYDAMLAAMLRAQEEHETC